MPNLVYAASNMTVPKGIFASVKEKQFRFLWKNKKDKIKRASVYQDYCQGGLRMVDIEIMAKALRLAWIRKRLSRVQCNWKSIPDHFFGKQGGLNFLLRCNYDVKHFGHLPTFYMHIKVF